jgi:hypothetical protein
MARKSILTIVILSVLAGLAVICGAFALGNPQSQSGYKVPDAGSPATKGTASPVPKTTSSTTPPKASPVPATIQEGVWSVGADIKAGTYRTRESVSGANCYWMKSSDAEGSNIIDNGLPTGGKPQVTLKKGQWFETRGCGEWAAVK